MAYIIFPEYMLNLPMELLKEIFNHHNNETRGKIRLICSTFCELIEGLIFRVHLFDTRKIGGSYINNVEYILEHLNNNKHYFRIDYCIWDSIKLIPQIHKLNDIYKITIDDGWLREHNTLCGREKEYLQIYDAVKNKNVEILKIVHLTGYIPDSIKVLDVEYFTLGYYPYESTEYYICKGINITNDTYCFSLPNVEEININYLLLCDDDHLLNIETISFIGCPKLKRLTYKYARNGLNIIASKGCKIN